MKLASVVTLAATICIGELSRVAMAKNDDEGTCGPHDDDTYGSHKCGGEAEEEEIEVHPEIARQLGGKWSSSSETATVTLKGYTDVTQPFTVKTTVCSYDALVEASAMKNCLWNNAAANIKRLGFTPEDIKEICQSAHDDTHYMPYREVFNDNDDMMVKEYFDGNEEANERRETQRNEFNVETHSLREREMGLRIKSIYENYSQKNGIKFPENIDNFKDCQLNSVMCCWVQDREASRTPGTCTAPYDKECTDADPSDNSDICYVDMERAPRSNHVEGGFGLFNGAAEGSTFCDGFAWSDDKSDPSYALRGNNLFYTASYENLYSRGYVRNIGGAPMCGCLEQMPVVSRSDCSQMSVSQQFIFSYDPAPAGVRGRLTVRAVVSSISFNTCYGNVRNDLMERIRHLHKYKKVSDNVVSEAEKVLVKNCQEPTNQFLATQGLQRVEVKADSTPDFFVTAMTSDTGRRLYATAGKVDEDGFGALPGNLGGFFYNDQRWVFRLAPDCPKSGKSVCFLIENFDSGRRLFANSGKYGEHGVGATTNNIRDDQKWYVWKNTSEKGYFYLRNKLSSRYVFAGKDKEWSAGVGAATSTRYWTGYSWKLQLPAEMHSLFA